MINHSLLISDKNHVHPCEPELHFTIIHSNIVMWASFIFNRITSLSNCLIEYCCHYVTLPINRKWSIRITFFIFIIKIFFYMINSFFFFFLTNKGYYTCTLFSLFVILLNRSLFISFAINTKNNYFNISI